MGDFFDTSNIIFVAVVLLFVLQGALIFVIYNTNKRITKFFNDNSGKSIEKVLEFELKKMKAMEGDIKQLMANVKWIEGISRKSVHKVGVVRFNPFKGSIGGDQSFSIALLDNKDDGVVISSLHGAEGTRVYAKAIVRGKSKYQLTNEEEEAIKKATS